jgi:3-isopropylmalate/(R)-2-methylmalate dehydratase large subunit
MKWENGGIEHIILPEKGIVRPGMLVIAADSHTCTYGGSRGFFLLESATTDLAAIWATGKTWLKVPKTIRVEFKGKNNPGFGKDFILYLIGKIGVDGARILHY